MVHKFVEVTVPEEEGVSEGINRYLKYASPRTLQRFLIARDFNLAKSTEMIQNSIVKRRLMLKSESLLEMENGIQAREHRLGVNQTHFGVRPCPDPRL